MTLNWSLLIDLIMIGLLCGTMVYAYALNKNLTKLRDEKAEFDRSITRLTASIQQAESGLAQLKLSAQEVGGHLETQVAAAKGLSQELQFMIESADSIANRLMGAAETGGGRATASNAVHVQPEESKPKSQAEARLIEELKRMETLRSKTAGGAP